MSSLVPSVLFQSRKTAAATWLSVDPADSHSAGYVAQRQGLRIHGIGLKDTLVASGE